MLGSKQTDTVASSLVESSANKNFSLNFQLQLDFFLHDLEALSHHRDLGAVCSRFIHLRWETGVLCILEDMKTALLGVLEVGMAEG